MQHTYLPDLCRWCRNQGQGWIDTVTRGWTDGWTDGWTEEWPEEWPEGSMEGWIDREGVDVCGWSEGSCRSY